MTITPSPQNAALGGRVLKGGGLRSITLKPRVRSAERSTLCNPLRAVMERLNLTLRFAFPPLCPSF